MACVSVLFDDPVRKTAALEPVPASALAVDRTGFNHLLAILPSGVVVLDGAGMVRECNAVALEFLGEPLVGQNWLAVIQRAFSPRLDDGHEVSLKDGRRLRIETRALAPEPGQVVVLTDLTETRALQTRLNRQDRLSTIGRMLASLAHQLRTPLASAMLYAGHLKNPELNGEHRVRFAERLQERLGHLESQIRDMLLFARGDNAIAEAFVLEEVLTQLATALEPTLAEAQATLTITPAKQPVALIGNPASLLGALQNLAENSLQACGSGAELRISVEIEADWVTVRVADNGPGINPALAEQIFEPFYTTKSQGTGLGLAVVKSVVDAHQGRIWLNPHPRQGAEFVLCLPLAAPRVSPAVSPLAVERR